MTNIDREVYIRSINNWLAQVIGVMQEQYRRPNYPDLMAKVDALDKQLPDIKRILIYLNNTGVK